MGKKIRNIAVLSAGLAVSLTALTACGGASNEPSADVKPTLEASPELTQLISDAQEENCLTVYGILDESILKALTDTFTDEYGIPVSIVRLVTADLAQRYSSEAEAGATVADAILMSYTSFFPEAQGNGWLQDIEAAEIPGYPDEFPADYTADEGATPIVSLVPADIIYNKDLISDTPDSWEIFTDPANKGELEFTLPTSTPAQAWFWKLMRDEYGDEFLEAVAANEPTWHNSAVPSSQATAAGEGAIGFPTVTAIVKNLQDAGAPVESVRLSPTTGSEIALGLSAESPCPSSAKLFANFLLSEEGNTYLSELSGDLSPFTTDESQYVRPQPVSEEELQEISAILGVR